MSRYKLGYVAPLKECPEVDSSEISWATKLRDGREKQFTAEFIRKKFIYDPDTGTFYHRLTGKPAGWLGAEGYWCLKLRYLNIAAHRVAWIYMTGGWPRYQVDHKDTDRANNKWENLREANHGQNQSNGKLYKNNRLGLKGVSTIPTRPGWFRARIRKNGHEVSLGVWPTAELAHGAYVEAAKKLHGEFWREK